MRLIRSFALLSLSWVLFVPACRCQKADQNLSGRAFPARLTPGLYASDQVEIDDIRTFYRRLFGSEDYRTLWSEQLTQGNVQDDRIPYLDSWYPEAQNGTNQKGALIKYDEAFYNGESKASAWELANHSRSIPDWYGHCNGTSAANARHQNPINSVNRPKGCTTGSLGCAQFTPSDIRALLSEMNMNAHAKFISGQRCGLKAETLKDVKVRPALRTNPLQMDSCDDVNPGSFHLALVNFIGRMKQPLIFDQSQDEEIWNYPVFGYSYTATGPLNEDEAISALGLPATLEKWVFNPNARSFYKVDLEIKVRYSTREIPAGAGSIPGPTRLTYQYVLELDDAGNIIGGEWTERYRLNHPDFIWMPFEPLIPVGDSKHGNPHLVNKEVIAIWAESVGLDPENPFRDKPKNSYDIRFFPPSDINWGRVEGYYNLVLDGRQSGTMFLGKKAHIRIEAAAGIKGNASVEGVLNGKSIGTLTLKEGKTDFIFDAAAGINNLELKWNAEQIASSELNWTFRFYAM